MKTKIPMLITLLFVVETGFSQGFVNLNFETATISTNHNPGGDTYTALISGWIPSNVPFNSINLDAPGVNLEGTNSPFVPAIEGNYSIFLQGSKPATQLTLTIHDIAFGGEGVGRVDDFVVFVPFVLVGETVEVEITEVKKNFARAKLLRVEKPSPERVAPECRYFGACGGCQYQHVAYPAQLRLKHKQIADLFERVGKIPSDKIAPVIPCPAALRLPQPHHDPQPVEQAGAKTEHRLRARDCGLVEDIEECKIAEPALNEQIRHVRAHPPPKGGIKVVLRVQPEDWDVPPDSFFQNNFFLLPKLVETVRGFLRDSGARHLIDLYCGVGFFGIELADAVESFVGVEYDQRAIQSARQKRGGAKNCQRRIHGGRPRRFCRNC
jgi:tRNA/tmRNA/rRNA uracil-C5-methylase (TrmA/RlmC/RlmD family)